MSHEQKTLQILMVEDVVNDAELVEYELRRARLRFVSKRVQTREDFILGIKTFYPDVILSDYALPSFSGLEALRLKHDYAPTIPFIIVTGALTEETAVECMKAGAADYVVKEHLVRLGPAVRGALKLKRAMDAERFVEEKLRKTVAELARSNADLERFAYVASHDLQEPLRMVASYVQLLARRYHGKLDTDADEFIQFAVDGATRMKEMIDGLLDYSRLGRQGKDFTFFNCHDVVAEAMANLKMVIQESGAVITCAALPMVEANAQMLTEVFQNLLSNAIKFRKNKDIPNVHVSAERQGSEWVFSISDQGIGIDPKDAERIFEIFQRLHTRKRYDGNGLGLAICKKIIESHGGRIWVGVKSGAGTTFHFSLPAPEEVACLKIA